MSAPAVDERFARVFSGERPGLETTRLVLRPFAESDAADVERLAGDFELAKTLLSMPHPYPEGAAKEWIAKHEGLWRDGKELALAITLRAGGALCGCIALHFALAHQHAEVGYWIARAHWREGLATEATRAVLGWGFGELGLHRIFARHMAENAASGGVMRRVGMKHEGTMRQHHWKHGRPHDFHVYGVLREEYLAAKAHGGEG